MKVFGDSYDMYIEPAVKPNSAINQGRGKGGLLCMWKKELTRYVSKIKTNNFRLQATKFSFPACPLLVINSYFMTDPRNNNFDDTDLLAILADIRLAIEQSQVTNILWGGDCNADFSRNTRFVQIIRDFIEDLGLVVFWSNPSDDPQHKIEAVHSCLLYTSPSPRDS